MKRRETEPASNQFPKCSPPSGTHRDSQSWVEKRRGREETEATWWRKRRVQMRREWSSQQSHSQVKLGTEDWVFKCTKLTTNTKKQRLKIWSRGWIFKNTLLKKRIRRRRRKNKIKQKNKATRIIKKQKHQPQKDYIKHLV